MRLTPQPLSTVHRPPYTCIVTRRRFLADEVHGSTAVLTGKNAAHLARVLRARVGQEYEIASMGDVRVGRITTIEDDRIEFELGVRVASRELIPITLLAAVFKFDRFEWAIEKATELGVARIVPVIARRTDAHLAKAADKRVERWRRIAHEASQQSRRTAPPEIAEPLKLKDALGIRSAGVSPAVARASSPALNSEAQSPSVAELKILLSEVESDRSLRSILENAMRESRNGTLDIDADGAPHLPSSGRCGMTITLAIGPEGGWTEDELQFFATAGWTSATLGPTILRAETAVVAGLAVCSAYCS